MKGIFLKYFKLQAGIGKGKKMKRARIMGKITGDEGWNKIYLRKSKTWGK
jgi:hypothetical protein